MSNTTLQRFDTENGIELIIDTQTGEAFASQSAIARMVGKGESTIRYWITSQNIQTKEAEIETATGLKTSQLLNEEAVFQAFAKYRPELLVQCAKAGIRVYLHKMAGFQVNSTALQIPKTYAEALLEAGRLAKELEEAEKERELLMLQNQDLEEENELLSEAVDELFDYSSIIRIAKFNNVSEKCFSWRKLKAVSTQLRVEIKKVPCPRFQTKNLYSHDAWRVAYPGFRLPETTTLVINS